MVGNIKLQDVACHFLYLLDARITEFEHFFAILANKVIVLLVFERFFELRQVLAELVLSNKITGQQKLYRVVKRCPAYTVLLVLHVNVKRLDIEMPVVRVDLVQYRKSFGSFPVSVILEVS